MARMVVKFYCDDGEIFRRQLPEPTFEAIVELVTNFRLDVKAHMLHEGRACALKYADDEGDQCVLTPSTFSDFLALQTVDQPLKLQLKLPSTKESLDHQRLNAEDANLGDGHPMLPSTPWRPSGSVAPGGGLQQFLHSLCTLQESGSVTAETLASLLVAWIPSLAQIAERRSEQIRDMAKNGPNPTLQKMLEIIQEQAASTPGLEHFAAVIAKVLGGEIDQRRLGKALPNMMKALQKLEVEVQTRFCEGVAHPLLPHVKELSKLSIACHEGGKRKGESGESEGKSAKRSKLEDGANHQPFSEGGGLRKFLLGLRGLQESGSVTAETLASLLVAWIPSLAQIAERRSEQIRDMAKNGPNPTLQKMLEIIQEQAASTPGLEHFAAVIAKVLGGEIDQRRLGKALPNMMKALQKLEVEVQTRFCEGVAHPLLPHVEELSRLSFGHNEGKPKGKGGKGKAASA